MPDGYVYPTEPPPPPVVTNLHIHKTVELNDWQRCEELLQKDPELVHQKGWNGISPLHAACIRNHSKIALLLLQYGADPNARSNYDETPLHYACRCGFIKTLELLIKSGADVESVDKQGRGCIHFAVMGSSIPAICYLEKKTLLTVHCVDNNEMTPLQYACMQHNNLLIDFLLRHNRSRIDHANNKGETVLHVAAKKGDGELVWRLLSHSTCALTHLEDNQGNTPLAVALKENTPKHAALARHLEGFMRQSKQSAPHGPKALWWAHLTLPFIWQSLVFFSCNFLNSHSGMFAIVALAAMTVVLTKQGHRINHISRWPNPIFLGMFVGSVIHCVLGFFIKLLPANSMSLCSLLLVTASLVFARNLHFLCAGDPGILRPSDMEAKAFGKPLTVLDIATDRCSEDDFCPFSEIIKPKQSKFCRICERTVMEMDHHCLFVNNCVAKNNHRAFVVMLLTVMIMQMCLSVEVYGYLVARHRLADFSPLHLQAMWELLLYHEAWLLGLLLVCAGAFTIELSLIYVQLRAISRNETVYFRTRGKVVSAKEALVNILRFFFKPKLREVEKHHQAPFMS